jgi:hypothetical protein
MNIVGKLDLSVLTDMYLPAVDSDLSEGIGPIDSLSFRIEPRRIRVSEIRSLLFLRPLS